MRPILQTQAAECTLACLTMVADHHGLKLDLADLRRRFAVSLKGSNLKQLFTQASSLGFQARALQLELDELSQLKLPCVLHWDLNHAVVLKRVHKSKITILDPAVGERTLSWPEVSRHFTGVAMELQPGTAFEKADERPKLKLASLTGKVLGLKRSLAQLFAVALVLQLFAIVSPMFNQLVVDEVLTSGDADLLVVLAVGFALLTAIQTGIGLMRSWMVMVLGQSLSLQWTSNVFAHLLRLPVSYFEARHLGDVTSRFGAVGAVQRTLTTSVIEALLDGIMAIASFGMMLLYAPSLAGVVCLGVLAYALLRWAMYQPLRDAAAERLVVAAKENTHFLETLRAITPLKLFGREQERRARWQNLVIEVQNRDVRTAKLNIGFSAANSVIFGVMGIAVFYMGARLVMQGVNQPNPFTVGMLFAFASYQGQFTGRIGALIGYAVEIRMLSLHAERLADIALTAPEPKDAPIRSTAQSHEKTGRQSQSPLAAETADLSHLEPTIELRNVSFRYGEAEPWVLKGVNLTIAAGESVAIVGASGGGKTTLLKVLLGLHVPQEGEVFYGGQPMKQLGLHNVRALIGTVMQEDTLLTGSVLDNICFFDTTPEPQRASLCAVMAQLDADIRKMPMGYQTLVGDLGSGLSGGQKQRLLLARALYKNPKVLALDEATSHLDVRNERAVTQALAEVSLTRIIIAHRPETIAGAQRVVQLVNSGAGAQVEEVLRRLPAQPTTESSATVPTAPLP